MKVIKFPPATHKELKIEAVRQSLTLERFTHSLVIHSLWLLKSGQIDLEAMNEADKRRTAAK